MCCRAGLQPLESFLTKAIQLYEMIVVRHGLMLVGQSYGMKTAAYRMLAGALTGACACVFMLFMRCQQGQLPTARGTLKWRACLLCRACAARVANVS